MNMQDIAAYALDSLKKAGADKASCKASKGRKDEFNIEANKFSLMRTLFEDELNLKALVDGRKGVVVVNKLDKASIDEAVENCITLAKSATPDDAEDIAPMEENQSFDQTIGGADMATLFSRTKEYLEQVGDELPKIMLEQVVSDFCSGKYIYANSNGVCHSTDVEYYHYTSMFVGKDGEKASSFNGAGAILADLKTPFLDVAMHRQMLEESVKSLDTRMVDGKFTGTIIVAPTCDDMIWQTLLYNFLSDHSLIEGTSRWKDSLGTTVADSKLTMRSVPLNPMIVAGERFTSDGFLSHDMDFIKDGVLKSFNLSLYGANKTGKPRATNSAHGSLEVLPGNTPLADMIKGIDRGILLNRFSGASPGASGDISGVAKNSFMIENGQVTDALQETMIAFNIVDALNNLTAISKERISDGANILPWCCFDGITVSGK